MRWPGWLLPGSADFKNPVASLKASSKSLPFMRTMHSSESSLFLLEGFQLAVAVLLVVVPVSNEYILALNPRVRVNQFVRDPLPLATSSKGTSLS